MKNKLLFLLLVLLISCKKEDTIYVPEEMKRNFSFKPGSYWIYRDSLSGREDSCYVEGISNWVTSYGNGTTRSGHNYEIFTVDFLQKPLDTNVKEKIKWTIQYNTRGFGIVYNTKSLNSGLDRAFLMYHGYYPFRIASELQIFPSFELNKNTFTNVYNMNNNKDGNYSVFFNDSVGYIKMDVSISYSEYNDTTQKNDTFRIHQIWELQRCLIVK